MLRVEKPRDDTHQATVFSNPIHQVPNSKACTHPNASTDTQDTTMFVESDSTSDIALGILSMQRIEIEEVVDAIHDNINQQRTDLRICLPIYAQ